MVLVDSPVFMKPNGRKKYAHMVADTLEELHAFAAQIGVKPHFFHKAKSGWHYDISQGRELVTEVELRNLTFRLCAASN